MDAILFWTIVGAVAAVLGLLIGPKIIKNRNSNNKNRQTINGDNNQQAGRDINC